MTSTTISRDVTTKRFTFEKAVPVFPKKRKGAYAPSLKFFLIVLTVSIVLAFAFSGIERAGAWGFLTYIPFVCAFVAATGLMDGLRDGARKMDTRRFNDIDRYFRYEVTPTISSYLDELIYPDASEDELKMFSFGGYGITHTLHIAHENKFVFPDRKQKRQASYGGVLRQRDAETGELVRSELDRNVEITYIDRNTVEVAVWIVEQK
jgi:hypothetical protein